MSNWHNDNWSGNDSNYAYPVVNIPGPIRSAMRLSFRFYLLVVCMGAFLWATYAGVQTIRSASKDISHTATKPQRHQAHSEKGPRF